MTTDPPISVEGPVNQNFNQSNNNDLPVDDDNDGVDKIFDAFERSYLPRIELSKQPMKVKYIPKDRPSTWPNRKSAPVHLFT